MAPGLLRGYCAAMQAEDDIAAPAPALLVHDGLACALLTPAGAPRGGVVILHGAGSCKENHLDFAQACALAGLAAIVFDQRGHGSSEGALGAGALDDVAAVARLLPPGPLFLRGSSMGGFLALAAAERTAARAVVAICPASTRALLDGLRDGRFEFRADPPALTELVATIDLRSAAAALGPNLLLLHAEGDERVSVEHSAALHAAAPGSRLVRVAGGDHGSVQHDADLQAASVQFLLERRQSGARP
jgi:pimeloyl-ACP methyl ester carboxylesterase